MKITPLIPTLALLATLSGAATAYGANEGPTKPYVTECPTARALAGAFNATNVKKPYDYYHYEQTGNYNTTHRWKLSVFDTEGNDYPPKDSKAAISKYKEIISSLYLVSINGPTWEQNNGKGTWDCFYLTQDSKFAGFAETSYSE